MSSVNSMTSAASIDEARLQIAASALNNKVNIGNNNNNNNNNISNNTNVNSAAIHNILTSQDAHSSTSSVNANANAINTNVNTDSMTTSPSTSSTKNSTVAVVAAAVMGSVNSPNTPDFARSSLGRLINLNRNITNSFGEALMTAHPTALGISSELYQQGQLSTSANIVTDLIVAL